MSNPNKNVTTLEDAPAKNTAPAEAVSAEAAILINHNSELSGVRKILTIHATGGEGGNAAVFAGLNGVGYQIPRGKPWNVPEELVENFKNAEEEFFERNELGKLELRKSPRFGTTVTDAPSIAKRNAA